MNKLEFLEKMEEVDSLIADGKYDLAVEICDTLNLGGVKEPRRLQNIAKAYERCRRYPEAQTLLQRVRRAVPRSRGVLFRLCSVAVRAGELEDAKDYLSDFIDLAPTDPERLILEYRIAEAEDRPDDQKIAILEKYLSEETDDRWMYALSELYVRNHREEEAAGVLNAIILWFDSGRYVAKAHAMLVKLGYEEAPQEAIEDVPVVPESRTEFPEMEIEAPEEVTAQEEAPEEVTEATQEGVEAAEAAVQEEESPEEAAEVVEETAQEEREESPADVPAEAAQEEPAAAEETEETKEVEEAADEDEDEHIVVNITGPRYSVPVIPQADEEDEAVWQKVFDEEKETAEDSEETAEELHEEELQEEAAEVTAAAEETPLSGEEETEEEPAEAAEEIEEEAEEESAGETEAAEEGEEAETAKAPVEAADEAAEEAAQMSQEETQEEDPTPAIGNFRHEEYGDVIAAEIRRRKEERIKFGNIPVEPEMSTSIWHFIAYGDTDELALECAREHVKEIAGINKNCPGKLLKISAEKIGRASIVSSLDRFLGNVVIVEHVSMLSDEQLQEFAKMLDHDDMSLLTVFTDTRENIIGVLKRVPALAGAFSAVYEGKKYTADELVLAAENYLRGEEARLSPSAEEAVRAYAEDILAEKRGFYRNRVIAYVGKALEAADKGGFLGFGAGKIDKNGILVVDAKHFKNL